jgi:hypothetical protein
MTQNEVSWPLIRKLLTKSARSLHQFNNGFGPALTNFQEMKYRF